MPSPARKRPDRGEWMPKGVLDEWQRKAAVCDRLMQKLIGKHEYDTLPIADIRAILEGRYAR